MPKRTPKKVAPERHTSDSVEVVASRVLRTGVYTDADVMRMAGSLVNQSLRGKRS